MSGINAVYCSVMKVIAFGRIVVPLRTTTMYLVLLFSQEPFIKNIGIDTFFDMLYDGPVLLLTIHRYLGGRGIPVVPPLVM